MTALLLRESSKIKSMIDPIDRKKWYNKTDRNAKKAAAQKATAAKQAVNAKKHSDAAKLAERKKAFLDKAKLSYDKKVNDAKNKYDEAKREANVKFSPLPKKKHLEGKLTSASSHNAYWRL